MNQLRRSRLFPSLFFLAALVHAWLLTTSVIDYVRVQSWEAVPARILSAQLVDLTSHSGYEVKAAYEYKFNGRRYKGTRVQLHIGDDIFDFHRKMYQELLSHQRTGKPRTCFVNPTDPKQSILHRELRWPLMAIYAGAMLLFGGVGVLLTRRINARRDVLPQGDSDV